MKDKITEAHKGVKGEGTLIPFLMGILHYNSVMKDEHGTFALKTAGTIIVAKRYVYNHKGVNYLSCHEKVVKVAETTQRNVVVYVGGENRFYVFDPADIADGMINLKDGVRMVNFDSALAIKTFTVFDLKNKGGSCGY